MRESIVRRRLRDGIYDPLRVWRWGLWRRPGLYCPQRVRHAGDTGKLTRHQRDTDTHMNIDRLVTQGVARCGRIFFLARNAAAMKVRKIGHTY